MCLEFGNTADNISVRPKKGSWKDDEIKIGICHVTHVSCEFAVGSLTARDLGNFHTYSLI